MAHSTATMREMTRPFLAPLFISTTTRCVSCDILSRRYIKMEVMAGAMEFMAHSAVLERRKHSLERMQKEREHAKMKEGREKVAAEGGVTSAASRSRVSETKGRVSSSEVEQRKEEMTSSKNQYLEHMAGDWWNAKMDGREKPAAEGGVTSTASGSANCWSVERTTVIEEVDEEVSPIATESTKTLRSCDWERGLEHRSGRRLCDV